VSVLRSLNLVVSLISGFLPFCTLRLYDAEVRFRTPEIAAAAAKLGILDGDLQFCMSHPDTKECCRRLVALQKKAKTLYKECALELHPDRTGDDPVKTELFKLVASVWETVSKMEIVPRPRPPAQRSVTITRHGGMSFSHGTGTSTSTNTTTGWGGWQSF
jgi:hypothetical protein